MRSFDIVRNYLLDMIESGAIADGAKFPAARDIVPEVKGSFLLVQHAISSLAQDGLLIVMPREGTYLNPDWRERIIPNHLVAYSYRPWIRGLKKIFEQDFPAVRVCREFKRGCLEIRTTSNLQQDRDAYIDLKSFLPESLREDGSFFLKPFDGFTDIKGRLFGIPLIFSPRVILYNKKILSDHNLPPPSNNWTWNTFISYIRSLRQSLPAEQVINFVDMPYYWMNFIFRAGGKLFQQTTQQWRGEHRNDSSDAPQKVECCNNRQYGDVAFDLPETQRGLKLLRELRQTLGYGTEYVHHDASDFLSGNLALALTDRQLCSQLRQSDFHDWSAVPLPIIPGGLDIMAQSTDVLCVRKECTDLELAQRFIRFMLSEKIQTYIGQIGYGIPIRKKIAMASIDPEDPCEMLFLSQINSACADFNVDSPVLTEILNSGIHSIISGKVDFDAGLARLADTFRQIVEIRNDIYQREQNDK